jgi:hypothetical protein
VKNDRQESIVAKEALTGVGAMNDEEHDNAYNGADT